MADRGAAQLDDILASRTKAHISELAQTSDGTSHVYPQPGSEAAAGQLGSVQINEHFKEVLEHGKDWDPEDLIRSDDPEHVCCCPCCFPASRGSS